MRIPIPQFDRKIVTVKNPICKKCGKKVFEFVDFKYGAVIVKRHECKGSARTVRRKTARPTSRSTKRL